MGFWSGVGGYNCCSRSDGEVGGLDGAGKVAYGWNMFGLKRVFCGRKSES